MSSLLFKNATADNSVFQDDTSISSTDYIGSNLLDEDIVLPTAVLQVEKLNHNLSWMQDFADHYGIKLCPHGKTTMCPYLFHQQLKMGAWGISLASATQVRLAHSFGITRILMVNQLVGKHNMAIIADLLNCDRSFQFACLVESRKNVEQLGLFFRSRGQQFRVLLEIGINGGRTGVRGIAEENDVVTELAKYSDSLKLIGVEFYEAIIKSRDGVRDFITRVGQRTQNLADLGAFAELPILISGAGSTWFDIVAKELSTLRIKDHSKNNSSSLPIELILRPGSYLTHEIGTYHEAEQRVGDMFATPMLTTPMMTSLQVWAYVQSVPEPGLAVVAMGKRETDVSFDCPFPVPCLHFRPGVFQKPIVAKAGWKVTYVMDQHTFLSVGQHDNLQVGDIIAFEACYPATTLDKFRNVLLIDEGFNVLDILKTYF